MRIIEDFVSKGKILYHYCSLQTFISIVTNRCLWLSDINTMNDFGEMHWAYSKFIEAINTPISPLDSDFITRLDKIVSEGQLRILPMLTAFSTDGDVLSQWRAYADDGIGVSVGFDAEKISNLSIQLAPIEYDELKQVSKFQIAIDEIYRIYKILPEGERDEYIFQLAALLAVDMSYFKNPAFAEEKEVRIIRAVIVKHNKDGMSLVDEGGVGDKTSRKKLPVKFRVRAGNIISYVELPLGGAGPNLIKEVVIGPKSQNSGNEISAVLQVNGFRDFKIRHSMSTYR